MRIYQLSDRLVSLLVAEATSDVEATAALNVARSVLGATSLQSLPESGSESAAFPLASVVFDGQAPRS